MAMVADCQAWQVSRVVVADAWHRSPDGHHVAPSGHEAAGEVVPQLAELQVTPTSVRVVGRRACRYSSGRGQESDPGEQLSLCGSKLVVGKNAVLV